MADKKKKMALIIAVQPPGGKAPKKPTKTSDVGKAGGMCGVKKAPKKNQTCTVCKDSTCKDMGCVS
tara:strand:- start:1013 stop:1210 length:198 start_codon:yes stop_codon:yes gene_type:complete